MFDTALLESRKGPKGRGKGAGLPLAIGLHAAVIGAFVGAAVWSVGEPPEPVTYDVFPVSAAPLPPHGDGGHRQETAAPPRHREALSQPSTVPTTSESPETSAREEGPEYPGPEQNGPPGDPTGLDGGTGDAPVATPGMGKGDAPLVVGGDVKAPVLLSRIEPEYPEAARRAHMEGFVILEAIITANGAVEEIRILKSANPLLDASAERAVRQWRYRPATLNGRAVRVYLTVTVTFGLRS